MAWLDQLTSAPTIAAPDDDAAQEHAPPSPPEATERLRAIFASLDDEIIAAVVTSNRGALVPSILQLIELANEDETAACMDELEAVLQDAAVHDEAPGQALPDEQLALAAQSDMDEQVALALQQKMDEDAAAAARVPAARRSPPPAAGGRAATPPTLSSWRRNVAKLAAKLSPSELGQVVERLRTGRYRSRAGGDRLIDPNDAGSAEVGFTADNNESDDAAADERPDERAYEPPVPPAPKPSAAALYEGRLARARTARLSTVSRAARPLNDGFTDLSLDAAA